jgi:hypothetical protein
VVVVQCGIKCKQILTQLQGLGLYIGVPQHLYEGWQAAPTLDTRTGPAVNRATHNDALLREYSYRLVFGSAVRFYHLGVDATLTIYGFCRSSPCGVMSLRKYLQTMGLATFNLGVFGLTPLHLALAVAAVTLTLIGPFKPIAPLALNGQPVMPLPVALLTVMNLVTVVSFAGFAKLFAPLLAVAWPGIRYAWAAAALAMVPLAVIFTGAGLEGLVAESTFDQRWHLASLTVVQIGNALQMYLFSLL